VEVCRRLDGIPLAIELAAARVQFLTVEQIAERLDDRFRLLTSGSRTAPPRHRTLLAALEWSYQLLSDAERVLFQRLSVFAGGWTLEAAESVCAGDYIGADNCLDLLGHLVAQSLVVVQVQEESGVRYRLLETLRQYAWDRLAEAGGVEVRLAQHADYFVALAEQAFSLGERPGTQFNAGSQHAVWLQRLDRERDNLWAALRWCVERVEVERGLQLGGAASYFVQLEGSLSEAREWLEALLQLLREAHAPRDAARARALDGAGALATMLGEQAIAQAVLEESLTIRNELDLPTGAVLSTLGRVAWRCGDYAKAQTLIEQSVSSARAAGDEFGQALRLGFLGQLFEEQGHYSAARASYTDSLMIYRKFGFKPGIADALAQQGSLALVHGDLLAANALCESSLALAREADYSAGVAWGCLNLALVRVQQKDWADARVLLEENLRVRGYLRDQRRIPRSLAALANVEAACGNPEGALRLFGAAMALREATRRPERAWSGPPFDRASLDRWEPGARAALGARAAAAADAAGRRLSFEEAIREALAGGKFPSRGVLSASG
jgi:tetratricopeptide (TPR) repeat protein